MTLTIIIVAIVWGALSGYLILRTLDSLLGIIACLHGLLTTRWKRLTSKAAPGQVKYSVILNVMLQVSLIGLFCAYLLSAGHGIVRREFWFQYLGNSGIVWGVVAGIVAIVFLRRAWRRLVVVWKMTHEYDYAEKRQRTFLLKV